VEGLQTSIRKLAITIDRARHKFHRERHEDIDSVCNLQRAQSQISARNPLLVIPSPSGAARRFPINHRFPTTTPSLHNFEQRANRARSFANYVLQHRHSTAHLLTRFLHLVQGKLFLLSSLYLFTFSAMDGILQQDYYIVLATSSS
jgi:hypothetical protein